MTEPSQPSQPSETALPCLVDADDIGSPLRVTGRTVLNWAEAGKIPTALRLGKIVRFDPVAVAEALGLLKIGETKKNDEQNKQQR